MPIPPPNFDGAKFAAKYNLDKRDFRIEGGVLKCPSLPNLSEADIADCILDLAKIARVDARLLAAKSTARAIPEWATWDQATAAAWESENIGAPLANARAAVPGMPFTAGGMRGGFTTLLDILDKVYLLEQKVAQLEIALRDQVWPDLPETNGGGQQTPRKI